MRPCIDNCGPCGDMPVKSGSVGRMLLAHTYVPWQTYDKAYSPREALTKGTLFPNLWGVYRIPR